MNKKNHPNQADKSNQKSSLASFIREQIAYVHAAQEQGFKLEIIYQALKEQTPIALSYNTFAVQLYRHRKTLKAQGQDVETIALNQAQINDLQKLQAKQAKLVKENLKAKLTINSSTKQDTNQVLKAKNTVKNDIVKPQVPVNLAQIQAIQQAMADLQVKQQLVAKTLIKQETAKLDTTVEAIEQTTNINSNRNTQSNLVKEIRNIFKQSTDIADLI